MSKTTKGFKQTALAAALTVAFGPALAEGDTELAPLIKPDSFISIGAGNWSKDRRQQGIYDGMSESGLYGLVDGEIVKRDDATGTWMILNTRNLGLDTREVRAEYLRQGNIGGFVEYNRTPREHPLKINTGVLGIGTTNLVVPNPSITPGRGSDLQLGTTRDLLHAGFYKNLLPGVDFKVSFKNEDKNGLRHWGRGGAPEFAVEPIDFNTQQLEALLEYTGERLQLSGGYYGSWFNNSNTLVDTSLAGANLNVLNNHIFLTLPLSNEAHQVFLNGGYSFTPTTRGTFKVSYSHATQDESLPTASIAGLPLTGSPTHLQGELDTTLFELGLSSRPLRDLSVVANLRYHDVRDKTPVARFVDTTNASGNRTTTQNTPFDFETVSGKVEATYRLPLAFSLTGGVEQRDQERTVPFGRLEAIPGLGVRDDERFVPFRSELEETTYRLQLRRTLSETINGSLAFLHSKRDGSEFSLTNEEESDEINPIHIADRDRNKWRLSLDWTPTTQLAFQFVFEDSSDEYGHDDTREFGLRDGDARLYSFDVSYNISSNWQVNAWYSHDKTEATQFNQRAPRDNAGAAELESRLEDKGDAVGVGLRGRPTSALTVGADLQWIRNESRYPQTVTLDNPVVSATNQVFPTSGGVTVTPLPDIENKLIKLALFAEYAVQKNAAVRLDFIHERWKTDDWSWMFSNGTDFTYGTTTDGTTVSVIPKQVSNFVGVRYIYTFQ